MLGFLARPLYARLRVALKKPLSKTAGSELGMQALTSVVGAVVGALAGAVMTAIPNSSGDGSANGTAKSPLASPPSATIPGPKKLPGRAALYNFCQFTYDNDVSSQVYIWGDNGEKYNVFEQRRADSWWELTEAPQTMVRNVANCNSRVDPAAPAATGPVHAFCVIKYANGQSSLAYIWADDGETYQLFARRTADPWWEQTYASHDLAVQVSNCRPQPPN